MVTSDTIEFVETETIMRNGQMFLNNVEVFNCSQIDTFKAALRFESASSLHSSVTNSTFHNGYGWGANIKSSANIHLAGNIWYNFRPVGVGIEYASNITFDDNIVSHIVERTTLETGDQVVDKRAAVCACCYFETSCPNIQVTNSLVAGAAYVGFAAMGHDCGDYTSNSFKNNVAHSIAGHKGGHGALVYADQSRSSHSTCWEASYFTAYKCIEQGIYSYYKNKKVIISNTIMIDNINGFGAAMSGVDYSDLLIELNDNKIYGESEIPDCPQDGEGGYCKKLDKFGLMISSFTFNMKDILIGAESPLPVYKIKSASLWSGKYVLNRNTFIGFVSQTAQGKKQYVIGLNKYASDGTAIAEFYDTTFKDIDESAAAYIYDPP